MKKANKHTGKRKSNKKPLGIFINPRTDFGFKRVFNDPKMMMSFLNEVISKRKQVEHFHVTSVTYLPVEHLGEFENERRVIVDSRCKIDTGEDIMVEMQNARPMNFANRLIYYSTYLIRGQMPERKQKEKNDEKTEWYYDLKAVYVVAIVNFPMIKGKVSKDVVIDWIRLMSTETKQTFSENLNFIIVDLTKFKKTRVELKTREDYWLYTLKYAETLSERPEEIDDELFIDLYDNMLRINKLTPEEMEAYNSSVLDVKSLGLFTDYARIEGEKRGEKRGKKEVYTQIVLNAANEGMLIEDIARITNLSLEQIRDILKKKK